MSSARNLAGSNRLVVYALMKAHPEVDVADHAAVSNLPLDDGPDNARPMHR